MSDSAKSRASGFNRSYIGSRPDILRLIPPTTSQLLDVGCSIGQLGKEAKQLISGLRASGIEVDNEMAEVAKGNMDRVIIADLNSFDFAEHFQAGEFDCIVFADVLEHTVDPWTILKSAVAVLSASGVVITSIPNVRHFSTLFSLGIKGEWPCRSRGIHDRTHLRFFTRSTIVNMLRSAGLSIVKESRNLRLVERGLWIDRAAILLDLPVLRHFFTFQYLHCSKPAKATVTM